MTQGRKALGKGLSALLGSDFETIDLSKDYQSKDFQVDMNLIEVNPYQPRTHFKQNELEELAESIKKYGVVQPVLVRRKDNGYQLIAGERRLQASKKAGMTTIPAVVKDLDDKQVFEIAIIENVQRENLNPIEEAVAYDKLIKKYGYTQADLAESMGKSRSHISNTLRLLNLSNHVRKYVQLGTLSLGHAKVLASYGNIDELADQAIFHQWSVRELEKQIDIQIKMMEEDANPKSQAKAKTTKPKVEKPEEYVGAFDDQYAEVAKMLQDQLGVPVDIQNAEYGGNLIINFQTMKQLDQLIQRLDGGYLNF